MASSSAGLGASAAISAGATRAKISWSSLSWTPRRRCLPPAEPQPDHVRGADGEADLLLGLAEGRLDRLAGARVAGHGDVERAGPGVLPLGAALEDEVRRPIEHAPHPDVHAAVPVAVAVHGGARLLPPEGRALARVEIEELSLVLRPSRAASP